MPTEAPKAEDGMIDNPIVLIDFVNLLLDAITDVFDAHAEGSSASRALLAVEDRKYVHLVLVPLQCRVHPGLSQLLLHAHAIVPENLRVGDANMRWWDGLPQHLQRCQQRRSSGIPDFVPCI